MPQQRGEKVLKIRTLLRQLGPDCEPDDLKIKDLNTSVFYQERKRYREELEEQAEQSTPGHVGHTQTTEQAILDVLGRLGHATSDQVVSEMVKKRTLGEWHPEHGGDGPVGIEVVQIVNSLIRKGSIRADKKGTYCLFNAPPLPQEPPAQVQDDGGIIELVETGKRLIARLGGREQAKRLIDVL
jgi:hypothetical protein